MARGSKRRRGSFLNQYRLDDAYLLKPDRKTGRPGILSGVNEDGEPVLVKVWPKAAGTADSEMREIWHHEVRQLHRLGGYPNAADVIATLQHTGVDDAGFYVVLDPGQRRPLATVLADSRPGHWLTNLRLPNNRARLWRNLLRVVSGFATLHTQGLLHKNLDRWAILTTGGDEVDFQLTGFEWSVRLVGAATGRRAAQRPTDRSGEPASFLQDWRDFGFLVADLMNVSFTRLNDSKVPLSGVSEYLTIDEVRLLRDLIQMNRLDRLDSDIVERRILEVLRNLDANIADRDAKLQLVVRLGTSSGLSQQIREASNNEVEINAREEQINFIRDDLSESPLLISVKADEPTNFRLVIQGTNLLYRLNSYLPSRTRATPTWEFAYCDSTEIQGPARVNVLGTIQLQANSLDVMDATEARSRFARMRGKTLSWETLRREFEAKKIVLGRDKRFHQALALTQYLEALYAAAEAFPVEVLTLVDETSDDTNVLEIRVRADAGREALSAAVGIKSPGIRFDEVLMNDRHGGDWILTEAQHVGAREFTDTSWRFDRKQKQSGRQPKYLFIGSNPAPPLNDAVLISGDFIGRDAQFQRRLKALRALADHSELLWMLVDPRRRILDTHDAIKDESTLADLDESKRKAMAAIVETLPLFLVQGPPGVGKTRMVRELVRYTFKNDVTARLLLTAQSNAAVDHLMDTIDKVLRDDSEDILIVRCRARDSNEDLGLYEIENQTHRIIQRFAKSPLVNASQPALRQSIITLASELNKDDANSDLEQNRRLASRYPKQAIEGLVVRAANVVFATTNSYELERLIEERGQFDWSIVEEAGKATGGELVSPLLLSYRRLLIGDHKQLSPFGSERIVRLLEDPDSVIGALKAGQEFISRTLRDPSTDEVLDEIGDASDDEFGALCSLAISCLLLFENLIETEFAQHERRPQARSLAHRLDQQHRMHPALAALVSDCFYKGELHTHPTAIKRFMTEPCPITSVDTRRLPDAPIVMIDMPYVQSTVNMKRAERQPRWHNTQELNAVIQAVKLIAPNEKANEPPSLAILSPYSEQVRRLQQRIDEDVTAFPKLSGFRPAVGPSTYCGTVDSFQGNEADIVVVSLVRNNHHSGTRSALGFLSDARRMNVLLSRARWRMLLICSSDFLRQVLKASEAKDAGEEISFLSRMLDGIEKARKENDAVVIPSKRLFGKGG